MPVVGKLTVEGFCLTLPGKQLDLSVLLKEKKFRHKGNKEGALRAMRILEEDGLGRLDEKKLSNKSSVKVRTYIHVYKDHTISCNKFIGYPEASILHRKSYYLPVYRFLLPGCSLLARI